LDHYLHEKFWNNTALTTLNSVTLKRIGSDSTAAV